MPAKRKQTKTAKKIQEADFSDDSTEEIQEDPQTVPPGLQESQALVKEEVSPPHKELDTGSPQTESTLPPCKIDSDGARRPLKVEKRPFPSDLYLVSYVSEAAIIGGFLGACSGVLIYELLLELFSWLKK